MEKWKKELIENELRKCAKKLDITVEECKKLWLEAIKEIKEIEENKESSEHKQKRLECYVGTGINNWSCFTDCAFWNGVKCTNYEN